jgi:uncharacterized protein
MPTLDWNVRSQVYVADRREEEYLLVNRESGNWAVSDLAGVYVLAMDGDDGGAGLPSGLRELFEPRPAPMVSIEPEPLIVVYKLTDKCNYRCSYCYDRSVARPKNPERRSAAIRAMLDRHLPLRPVRLLFHGGEPLLEFAEIRDLVLDYREYTPKQLSYSLQTNLSQLDQRKLDFLLEHKIGISVSLDGHDAGLNSLRMIGDRPNPYDLLRKKMRELQGLRADNLGLLMTVGKHNAARLTESLIAFQEEGFRSVSFSFMQDVGAFAGCATPGALTAAMAAVTQAIVERKIEAIGCMTLIQWVRRLTRGHSGFVCLGSPCGAGTSVATVLADGDVGPCDSIYSDRFFHRDVDHYIEALDHDADLLALRQRSVRKLDPCSKCDVQAHCNGTCPGSAVLATGGIQSVDPHECAFHYGTIRDLLWTLCDPQAGPQLLKYCERHVAARKEYGF